MRREELKKETTFPLDGSVTPFVSSWLMFAHSPSCKAVPRFLATWQRTCRKSCVAPQSSVAESDHRKLGKYVRNHFRKSIRENTIQALSMSPIRGNRASSLTKNQMKSRIFLNDAWLNQRIMESKEINFPLNKSKELSLLNDAWSQGSIQHPRIIGARHAGFTCIHSVACISFTDWILFFGSTTRILFNNESCASFGNHLGVL